MQLTTDSHSRYKHTEHNKLNMQLQNCNDELLHNEFDNAYLEKQAHGTNRRNVNTSPHIIQ